MIDSIWNTIFFSGIIQGIILIVALISINPRSRSNWLLSILIALTCINISMHLIISTGFYKRFPYLLYYLHPLLFLMGSVYYFYIMSMLEQKVTFNKIDLWHLIPIVLFTIYSLPMLMTPATELIPQIESRWFKNRIFSSTEINITLSPHRLLIFAFSCYLFGVIKRKKEKHTQFAMTSFIDWISGLNIGFGLYWILSFMVIFLLGFQQRIGLNHYHFVMIFMALFIYGLAYLSIAKNKEFSIIFLEGRIEKYQKNSVPNKVLNQYLQEIKNFFETEKPYLNPELRLTDVAAKLGVSPNTISQTINLQTGKNYYEYVNEYRHLEFRKKLKGKNTKRFTILALALESGYNNKQTAINIFKKYEGCTPSQFLKIENTQV